MQLSWFLNFPACGWLQPRIEGNLHPTVDTDCREKDSLQVCKGDGALRPTIYKVAETVLRVVEVEQDAYNIALLDSAFNTSWMIITMEKPAPLVIYIHTPAFVIFS